MQNPSFESHSTYVGSLYRLNIIYIFIHWWCSRSITYKHRIYKPETVAEHVRPCAFRILELQFYLRVFFSCFWRNSTSFICIMYICIYIIIACRRSPKKNLYHAVWRKMRNSDNFILRESRFRLEFVGLLLFLLAPNSSDFRRIETTTKTDKISSFNFD